MGLFDSMGSGSMNMAPIGMMGMAQNMMQAGGPRQVGQTQGISSLLPMLNYMQLMKGSQTPANSLTPNQFMQMGSAPQIPLGQNSGPLPLGQTPGLMSDSQLMGMRPQMPFGMVGNLTANPLAGSNLGLGG